MTPDFSSLTAAEMRILVPACKGLSNKQIARELKLSPATVASALKSVYPKLGVKNRTAAAVLAAKAGLV